MISLPRFEQWLEIARIEPLAESPEITAGRQAEEFLKGLVDSNLRFKGAHCFIGKRVPAPALRRRFEIDLVVLTRKQLHILEVKNWSGELFPQRKGWVQRKRDGREIEHQNLTRYNSQKVEVLLDYLQQHGVNLKNTMVSQKVLFMNERLTIHPDIMADRNVIARSQLDDYLASQKGSSYGERLLFSVIEACLDAEKSTILVGGLFKAIKKREFKEAVKALSDLRTWDLVGCYGGRTLQGDGLSLRCNGKKYDLKKLENGKRLEFRWQRNRVVGLLGTILTRRPIGKVRGFEEKLALDPRTANLLFHAAGQPSPTTINLKQLEWFVRG